MKSQKEVYLEVKQQVEEMLRRVSTLERKRNPSLLCHEQRMRRILEQIACEISCAEPNQEKERGIHG